MEEDKNAVKGQAGIIEVGTESIVDVDNQNQKGQLTEGNAAEEEGKQEKNEVAVLRSDYQEETSAEFAEVPKRQHKSTMNSNTSNGTLFGAIALILSILSLFMMPFIMGVLGIILGFIARARGSSMGTWAIGIGAVSIIVGIFILPFF